MMSSTRRKRRVATQIKIKQEPEDYDEKPKKRQKGCHSQASSLLMKVKKEPMAKSPRRKTVAPVTISPPGSKNDDGSLKMKFILSPKKEQESIEEEEDEEEEEEEEEEELPPQRRSKKDNPSKKNPSLKLKFSFKPSPDENKKGSATKKTDDEPVHPKKRFKTSFEGSKTAGGNPAGNRGKLSKFDSDSGYSDAQTGNRAKFKTVVDSPVPDRRNLLDVKDKKKKRKEKDKKKKFFKNKSDKNRFLNVHRSSDEAEDGWIEEKVKVEPPNEYEVISSWTEPDTLEPEVIPDVLPASPDVTHLKPIKLKKDKKKSKSRSKRKRGKKSKRLLHHLEKKKKDKVSFTQEQIVKIQQRLMMQGLKLPSGGGEDICDLNFSSHGEDLISQLTASSGQFDPSSLLDELEEPVLKPIAVKFAVRKIGKGKLKEKPKKRKPVHSAYQMWCKANRASILEQTPGLDFASMSRQLGVKWHSLPEKEKTKWKHKQRAMLLRHKNVPALSRMKKHVQKAKARSQQYKAPPPHSDPIDVAAHLKLLGDSLTNVGRSLINQASGETEVHGSVSVLMDSMLSAIAPLLCLTSQVAELNVIPKKTQSSLLENIAYIMPGL